MVPFSHAVAKFTTADVKLSQNSSTEFIETNSL